MVFPMKRRCFNSLLASSAALAAVPFGSDKAHAQASVAFYEGRDYRKIAQPVVTLEPNKIEVLEFFMYSCPHCHALEPTLEDWAKRLPSYVTLRRIPAVFGALPELHAKLFYTLEAMGQLSAIHARVFAALHIQRRTLDKVDDIIQFAVNNGLNQKLFADTFHSFAVATQIRKGKQLIDGYDVDGVPTLGVDGRWATSVSMAGGNQRALAVVDYLIAVAQKSKSLTFKK